MKKVHRFIGEFDLKPAGFVLRDAELLHQLFRVLKLKPEERIELCDGNGREAVYTIVEISSTSARLSRDEDPRRSDSEPSRHVTAYAAVLKREYFEWAVQKMTECGVSEIVPVIGDRTVKKGIKRERLVQIAKEAAEQSGRGRVPIVHDVLSLKAALAHAEFNEKNYFFHVAQAPVSIQKISSFHRIGLFIGPEGGWTDEEAEFGLKAGCEIASLGPRVLRGETACAVAVFLANQA